MTGQAGVLYTGRVVHRRVRPVTHRLQYRVFALLLDVARLDEAAAGARLLSVGRFNVFGIDERDHGRGDGSLLEHLRGLADGSGAGAEVSRFLMLCYPRVLGWVFNPLTVYFGLDGQDRIRLMVYEVNNTFGERETYVIPTGGPGPGGIVRQSCGKVFYVSPFNAARGRYRFSVRPPAERVLVAVGLEDETGPVMNALFEGRARDLDDRSLMKAFASAGWMTLKVSAAIRFEALKLWLKGLKTVPRPAHPRLSVTYVEPDRPSPTP